MTNKSLNELTLSELKELRKRILTQETYGEVTLTKDEIDNISNNAKKTITNEELKSKLNILLSDFYYLQTKVQTNKKDNKPLIRNQNTYYKIMNMYMSGYIKDSNGIINDNKVKIYQTLSIPKDYLLNKKGIGKKAITSYEENLNKCGLSLDIELTDEQKKYLDNEHKKLIKIK